MKKRDKLRPAARADFNSKQYLTPELAAQMGPGWEAGIMAAFTRAMSMMSFDEWHAFLQEHHAGGIPSMDLTTYLLTHGHSEQEALLLNQRRYFDVPDEAALAAVAWFRLFGK